MILWEVISRKQPFKELNAFAISYQVGTQGRLLPIPDIDATSSGAAATTELGSGSPPAESSRAEQPSGSTGQSTQNEAVGNVWWRALLQDCFRAAGDRPTLDQIIATIRNAQANSRPPVPQLMNAQAANAEAANAQAANAQAANAQNHAAGTHSGAPAAQARVERTSTIVGSAGQER